MSNLDKRKREALKKFRGQETNDDYDSDRMFTHHHDGTYGVHNHFGVVSFYIMTYEERKELLVKRIAVIDEFFINCNITANSDWCGIYSYDWHEADKAFQDKKKLEAVS